MAHHPAPYLDELQLKTSQRPALDCLGQAQSPQEASQVVGQDEELETHPVGHKPVAGETGLVEGILARLDPLLRRPPSIAEVQDALSFDRDVGHDEAHGGTSSTRCPSTFAATLRGRLQLPA